MFILLCISLLSLSMSLTSAMESVCPSNYSYCVGNFTQFLARPLDIDIEIGNETNEYCSIKNQLKFYNLKMHMFYSMNMRNKKKRRNARSLLNNRKHIDKITISPEVEQLGSNICDINYSKLNIEEIKFKLEKEGYIKPKKNDLPKNISVTHLVIIYFLAVILFYRGEY